MKIILSPQVSNYDAELALKICGYDFSKYDTITNIDVDTNETLVITSLKQLFRNNKPDDLNNWMKKYFNNKNHNMIITDDITSMIMLEIALVENRLKDFLPYSNQILITYDGYLDTEKWNILNNFNLKRITDGPMWSHVPTYEQKFPHINRENKFLCTTIARDYSNHRHLLYKGLADQNLLDYNIGRIVVDNRPRNERVKSAPNDFVGDFSMMKIFDYLTIDCCVSWDLYKQASFEIVPETAHQNISFVTEKTIKPMVAKIPFLVLGDPNFYKQLHNIGFKTFDSLIDESFAYEIDINIRTKKLVETAKSIISNGALDFYKAAQDICEYNFNHLLYIREKNRHERIQSMIDLIEEYIKNKKLL